ncbi:MAG: peptide chain release factor N(5)-glutamine methyltransferase, partial [Mycoplasmatales bacterium]
EFMLYDDINSSEIDLILKEILKKERPIAHIIGYEIFYGYKIFVSSNVLIPRVETEELVYNIINDIKYKHPKNSTIKIVDVCTGSGVIGITILKELGRDYNIELTITDISKDALDVAKKNFKYHNLKCNILCGDLLEPLKNKKFDILVSNPPYIPSSEILEDIVLNNEPKLALFGGKLGYEPYELILKDVKKILKNDGLIYFEIGDGQGNVLNKLCKKHFNKEVIIINDLFGRQRIVKIQL